MGGVPRLLPLPLTSQHAGKFQRFYLKCIVIMNILLDVAKVLLDLGLELAGGD